MTKGAIYRLFKHPLARNVDLDTPESTLRRAYIIQNKPFLKQYYHDCYNSIGRLLPQKTNGPVVEIGSGGGFLKDYIPGLVTSEILKVSIVDLIFDGESIPFKTASLRAIVMMDVFHHIPCPDRFLTQAAEVIKSGGRIIMIEPWVTTWSRFVYKYLHHEPFNPGVIDWHFQKGRPLSAANSAIPWIVFNRDRLQFERRFPEWQIKQIISHTPFSYLLSGGVSFKSFVPGAFYKFCRQLENKLQRLNPFIAMFATIVLGRR